MYKYNLKLKNKFHFRTQIIEQKRQLHLPTSTYDGFSPLKLNRRHLKKIG